jgi:hypothetical protein
MIHFLSRYRQQFHYEKPYWLTKAEKKRAVMFVCGILACVIALVLIWTRS